MLRIRGACKTFAVKHENALQLLPDLLSMNNNNFWIKLEEAELLVCPFCDASFLMQRDANTMADVVLVLLNLYRHIVEYCGTSDDAKELLVDIEKRWHNEENPLFFLTFALHPAYRQTATHLLDQSWILYGNWRQKRNYFSVSRVIESAKFYYCKFELLNLSLVDEETKQSILNDLGDSVHKWLSNERLDVGAFKDGSDPFDWWRRQKVEFPAIANLAMFLLDAPVQSASCERLFKEFSRLHTKSRNRLDPQTTHMMAQVKYNVRRKYRDDLTSANKRSTNRYISPDEHCRLDTPISPARNTLDNDAFNPLELLDSDNEEADYLSDEEMDDGDELMDENESDLERLIAALSVAVPEQVEDDGMFYATNEQPNFHNEDGAEEATVECFERRRIHLPELPEDNDPKYPQEDNAYFKRSRPESYVRTDKYPLSRLYELCTKLTEKDDIPSIRSVYNKKK